jgi:hypothetical protein
MIWIFLILTYLAPLVCEKSGVNGTLTNEGIVRVHVFSKHLLRRLAAFLLAEKREFRASRPLVLQGVRTGLAIYPVYILGLLENQGPKPNPESYRLNRVLRAALIKFLPIRDYHLKFALVIKVPPVFSSTKPACIPDLHTLLSSKYTMVPMTRPSHLPGHRSRNLKL